MRAVIKRPLWIAAILAGTFLSQSATAQTFFESAKGDGAINFARLESGVTSQFKLGLATSALSYSYNYVGGNLAAKNKWLAAFSVSAKPDDNSLGSFIKSGQLQPGFTLTGSIGRRMRLSKNPFQLLDIYFKPQYGLDAFNVYDATRAASGEDPVFKARESTYGGNILVNYAFFPGGINLYLGGQLGLLKGNNVDALDDGSVATQAPYAGTTTKVLETDVKAVKVGQLSRQTLMPLKFDLVVDPNIVLAKGDTTNNLKLGFFSYYRSDVHINAPINRSGLGICFLSKSDPSKIFTSIGFEFPTWGSGVTADAQKTNKGLVFATIGYTIK